MPDLFGTMTLTSNIEFQKESCQKERCSLMLSLLSFQLHVFSILLFLSDRSLTFQTRSFLYKLQSSHNNDKQQIKKEVFMWAC